MEGKVEIARFCQGVLSGKDEQMQRGSPVRSAALTPEQQEILAKRGVLSPDEIHKLASKVKKVMTSPSPGTPGEGRGEGPDRASCHSDYVDPETARKVQEEKLVQVGVGVKTSDSVI